MPDSSINYEAHERYVKLCHALQTGVAAHHQFDDSDGTPKHLRVGVNLTKVEHGALVELLIEKGIITGWEYQDKVISALRREVESYEKLIEDKTGHSVKLH